MELLLVGRSVVSRIQFEEGCRTENKEDDKNNKDTYLLVKLDFKLLNLEYKTACQIQ